MLHYLCYKLLPQNAQVLKVAPKEQLQLIQLSKIQEKTSQPIIARTSVMPAANGAWENRWG
jgi:hypothetical protein